MTKYEIEQWHTIHEMMRGYRAMQNWLVEAGFENPSLIRLPEWLGGSLGVAYKLNKTGANQSLWHS